MPLKIVAARPESSAVLAACRGAGLEGLISAVDAAPSSLRRCGRKPSISGRMCVQRSKPYWRRRVAAPARTLLPQGRVSDIEHIIIHTRIEACRAGI